MGKTLLAWPLRTLLPSENQVLRCSLVLDIIEVDFYQTLRQRKDRTHNQSLRTPEGSMSFLSLYLQLPCFNIMKTNLLD